MRLATAVGLLASTLPATSEKFAVSDVTRSLSEAAGKDPAMLLQQHSLAANEHRAKSWNDKWRNVALARRAGQQKRRLKNIQSEQATECDPTSVSPDVGVLSCGAGNYCVEAPTSMLGGVCGRIDSALKNKAPHKRPVTECDPSATNADIGVLDCGAGMSCVESADSQLGGFCRRPHVASDRRLDDIGYEEEDAPAYLYCDPTSDYYGVYDCDCDNWDANTRTGTMACDFFTDYCFGGYFPDGRCNNTCGSLSATYEVQGDTIETTITYGFNAPYDQEIMVAYSENVATPDLSSCSMTFNDMECTSCTFEPNCTRVDCTNTDMGASFCLEDSTPPILEKCMFANTTLCPVCHGGNLTNVFGVAYFPDGTNSSCLDLLVMGYFGYTTYDQCDAIHQYAYTTCCEETPCFICPDGLAYPSEQVVLGEYGTMNCSVVELLGVIGEFGNSTSEDCFALSAYVSEKCCGGDPIEGSCPLCPEKGYVVNPGEDFNILLDSHNCFDAHFYGTVVGFGGDCEAVRAASNADCCESDIIPCHICASDDQEITKPDVEVDVPGFGMFTCAQLVGAGQTGQIPQDSCGLLNLLVQQPCGCMAPTDAPTVAPTPAHSDAPTAAPTSGSSNHLLSAAFSLATLSTAMAFFFSG